LFKKVIKAENVRLIESAEAASEKLVYDAVESEEKKRISDTQEACEREFSKGLEEGTSRAKQELYSAYNAVEKLIEELRVLKQNMWEESESEVLKLALLIAEKIIYREISLDQDIIIGVLKDAVGYIKDKEEMKIRLNPKDYDYIIDVKPDLLSNSGATVNFIFEKDEHIQPGGAAIETLHAEVDARIEHRFKKMREALGAS